jgi:hypothetical protein
MDRNLERTSFGRPFIKRQQSQSKNRRYDCGCTETG